MISNLSIYIGAVAIALGAWGYVQTERLEDSRQELTTAKANAEQLTKDLAAERLQAEQQSADRQHYLAQMEAASAEINALRAAVDDGHKRLRIKASCPKPAEAAANPSGTGTAYAELDSEARRTYYDLRSGIITLQNRHALCMKELRRAHQVYSSPADH